MNRIILCIFFIVFLNTIIIGNIIEVPKDQPTIQDGIDVASPGDVVLVSHGTYFENINFMGKAITVTSHFYLDQKEKHIRKTIINGSLPSDPDFGSVVSFVSGEDTNSVLCGFTITGGTGTVQVYPGFPPMRQGGGIFCLAAGAKIIHNRIIENTAGNTGWAMGGGFANGPPFIPTCSIIENNLFKHNRIEGQAMATGGAITFNSAGRIVNNIVTHNEAYSYGASSAGGGIALSSWQEPFVYEVLVHKNEILHNKALQAETGLPGIGSHGGGLTIVGSKGRISNNTFMFNEVCPVDSGFGAGVVLDFPPQDLFFKNNVVSNNYFTGNGNCFGGGVAIWDGSPTLENNVIEKNKGTIGGALWTGLHFCDAKLINNTISKNKATVQGGAINAYSSNLIVMNSILWDNKSPENPEIYFENGTMDITYSDVKGGWTGTGNLDINPRLFGSLLFLGFRSPCIDAGNPEPLYNDPESIFRPGYAKLPARGTIRNDMGAYGGPWADDWWNFFVFVKEMEDLESEEKDQDVITGYSEKIISITEYPNPFNLQTNIQFELPFDGFVNLKIYNVLGQEVATLVSDKLFPGNYKYTWDASGFASGIYYYKLVTGDYIKTRKLILLK